MERLALATSPRKRGETRLSPPVAQDVADAAGRRELATRRVERGAAVVGNDDDGARNYARASYAPM